MRFNYGNILKWKQWMINITVTTKHRSFSPSNCVKQTLYIDGWGCTVYTHSHTHTRTHNHTRCLYHTSGANTTSAKVASVENTCSTIHIVLHRDGSMQLGTVYDGHLRCWSTIPDIRQRCLEHFATGALLMPRGVLSITENSHTGIKPRCHRQKHLATLKAVCHRPCR